MCELARPGWIGDYDLRTLVVAAVPELIWVRLEDGWTVGSNLGAQRRILVDDEGNVVVEVRDVLACMYFAHRHAFRPSQDPDTMEPLLVQRCLHQAIHESILAYVARDLGLVNPAGM